ncbi:hypothetical protein C8F04DRAFT_966008 [Mycena alexandri]|uniref:Uncharacterized protein n=1 Tax=Mycena alexandri TaxID=1745969 RepID=A0AAD6SHB0_9AGAR|nr:hypothetical protein C8F04DRAFT_966008 [Mycena alexandri]
MREQDLASAVSSSSASPSSAVVLLHSKSTSDWDLEDEDTSDPEAEEDLGTSRALTVVPRTIPAWSRRAAAAPALGLPSSTLALHQRERELAALGLGEERVPGAFPGSASASVTSFQLDKDTLASAGLDEKPKSTATSSAVERSGSNNVKPRRSPLDAALAMQLRPGLGLGADGAWLVRFLMSFFGWFAVLVAGGREFS